MLDWAKLSLTNEPFPHAVATNVITLELEQCLLRWFESTAAPWSLIETSFYEQYEFSFLDVQTPDEISILKSKSFVAHCISNMESLFETTLSSQIDVLAHKLAVGQHIGIHNDSRPSRGESHRAVIQLNRGLGKEQGGLFMLFASQDPNDVRRVLAPVSRSGLCFEISAASYHAISTLHKGTRYTLVLSFYQRDLSA